MLDTTNNNPFEKQNHKKLKINAPFVSWNFDSIQKLGFHTKSVGQAATPEEGNILYRNHW